MSWGLNRNPIYAKKSIFILEWDSVLILCIRFLEETQNPLFWVFWWDNFFVIHGPSEWNSEVLGQETDGQPKFSVSVMPFLLPKYLFLDSLSF
jgi:hypothetical protein